MSSTVPTRASRTLLLPSLPTKPSGTENKPAGIEKLNGDVDGCGSMDYGVVQAQANQHEDSQCKGIERRARRRWFIHG
jgi:hypothetical protein